jgi:hypothetical protein
MEISVQMCRASLDRNDELLAGYSERKIKSLVATLDDLIRRAQGMVEADEVEAAGE